MIAVGIDPGRMSGLAIVHGERGALPHLLGVWRVTGEDHEQWWNSAGVAMAALAPMLAPSHPIPVWIEEPPPSLGHQARKAGGLGGDTNGLRSWCGLGRYQGLWIAQMLLRGIRPRLVEVKTWANTWGPHNIQPRKSASDQGRHRILEAGTFIVGAREALAELPETGRVDCAEAVLIAGAAWIWASSGGTLTRPPTRRGAAR